MCTAFLVIMKLRECDSGPGPGLILGKTILGDCRLIWHMGLEMINLNMGFPENGWWTRNPGL